MEMKYFRFLFCETRTGFVHFGELRDTRSGEHFTFLYLKGTEGAADQTEEAEEAPFLCPDYVDLAVAARADAETMAALAALGTRTAIGTLVIPAREQGEDESEAEKITEHMVALSPVTGRDTMEIRAAGRKILLKCCRPGSVVMMHSEEGSGEEKETMEYEDCVMSVKNMDAEKSCLRHASPDGYGCALGCVLGQDYDVCRYRGKDGLPPAGVLMLSGEDGVGSLRELQKKPGSPGDEFRFIGLPEHGEREAWKEYASGLRESRYKRYYIGPERTMEDRVIAGICRDGQYQIPVPLGKGEGICCAGFLKYKE